MIMPVQLSQLNQWIHNDTDNRFFLSRICLSLKTITKEKGSLVGSTTCGAILIAKVYTLMFSYFCMEGVVRSGIDVMRDQHSIVGIRPLGDMGGWTDLTIFSTLTLGAFLTKVIREGEYMRLKAICEKWIQSNKKAIQQNPKLHKILYTEINDLLDTFSSQCLFSKSLVSRRMMTLDIYQHVQLKEKNSKHLKDVKLQKVFSKIQSELETIYSPKQYFQRVYIGQKSIKKGGCSKHLSSLILGFAIPIILLTTVVLSCVGEVGLGKELFIDKEELTDVGHFGEWPFNGIEALGAAFFLHLWCMINEGDLIRTQKVYSKYLKKLENTPNLHNHLCDIANEELSQLSIVCQYFKLPLDYKFEKI